jgi:NADH pyrophosphatase NudC (nudix superfamily)
MPQPMSYLAQYSWPFGPSLTLAAMAKSKASDIGRKVKMIENLGSIA